MFDVKKPDYANKTFRMPAELMERLSIVAQIKKVSVNYLVIQCCEYNLAGENDTAAAEPQSSEEPVK